MDENLMTESVGDLSNVAGVMEKNTLENVLNVSGNRNNEQVILRNQSGNVHENASENQSGNVHENASENQSGNASDDKPEMLGKSQNEESKLDAEKGMLLMLGGTDDEIKDYFGSQGVQLSEILKERDAFQSHVREITYTNDLNDLQKEFSFVTAKKIQEIPNFEKFAKLRASGLSAIESFEGASGKLISMEYLKNRDEFSYSHLKSTGLKGSVSADIPIPKDEVAIWKSAFPNDNYTQLTKRYNKTKYN